MTRLRLIFHAKRLTSAGHFVATALASPVSYGSLLGTAMRRGVPLTMPGGNSWLFITPRMGRELKSEWWSVMGGLMAAVSRGVIMRAPFAEVYLTRQLEGYCLEPSSLDWTE